METRQKLSMAIVKAFADVRCPPDSEIISTPGDYEADELYNHVHDKTWQELLHELQTLAGQEFRYYHSVYGFFTPQAFRYYLPAFMVVSLDPVRADTVAEYLLVRLAPSKSRPYWHRTFAKMLTLDQGSVIRRFLLYLFDTCHRIGYGDITDIPELRSFWFPEGFPRPATENLPLNGNL